MIKNRIHVIAQYLRVKTPADEASVEELLKQIIESLKFSNRSNNNSNQKYSFDRVVSSSRSRSRGHSYKADATIRCTLLN